MKVLVIGSEGYIGRRLCASLEREGHIIRRIDGMVYRPTPARAYVSGVDERWLRPDTCLAHAISDIDATVYLAALAHDPEGKIPRQAVIENNFITPKCLWDNWLHRKPMVIVSSMSVLNKDQEPAYIRSKAMLEAYFDGWRDVRVLRFGTIYGPGEDVESFRSHLLLNKMVMDALFKGEITVFGPELWRPVLHIDNAVAAIIENLNPSVSQPDGPKTYFDHSAPLWQHAIGVANFIQRYRQHPVAIRLEQVDDSRSYGEAVPYGTTPRVDDISYWLEYEGSRVRCIGRERQATMYKNLEERYGK